MAQYVSNAIKIYFANYFYSNVSFRVVNCCQIAISLPVLKICRTIPLNKIIIIELFRVCNVAWFTVLGLRRLASAVAGIDQLKDCLQLSNLICYFVLPIFRKTLRFFHFLLFMTSSWWAVCLWLLIVRCLVYTAVAFLLCVLVIIICRLYIWNNYTYEWLVSTHILLIFGIKVPNLFNLFYL